MNIERIFSVNKKVIIISVMFFLIVILLFNTGCNLVQQPATGIDLPGIFNHHMVLQQKTNVPVWGVADPGGQIYVEIAGQQKTVIVDENGKWQTALEPLQAGGPHELVIIGKDTITFKNIMVGEVWLCSGQSNMEMSIDGYSKVLNFEEEISGANFSDIRLFKVEHTMSNTPISIINSGGWKQCSPKNISGFSAVAYFFGRMLYQKLDIPIGLIQSSWGGTVVEAWTSAGSLKQNPDFAQIIGSLESNETTKESYWNAYKKKLRDWDMMMQDKIDSVGGFDHGWEKTEFDAAKWKEMKLPTVWENAGLNVDGIVWFRKEIEIPPSWQGEDVTLSLGPINDFDVTWFNGEKVGSEANVLIPRIYNIPGSLVKAGRNIIAVQVLDFGNKGGIYGKPGQLKLVSATRDSISLVGAWRYKTDPIKLKLGKLPPGPNVPNGPNRPTVLFNGMISPIIPYAMRGAIWYQGESNASRAHQYRTLFKTHINDWRKLWDQGDFPFLFVQLANFMAVKPKPEDDAWAELREAQLMTLSLPNTGMAVAIDIGEAKDIHPKNKQEVGRRLALNALNLVYKKDIVHSGPIYKSMTTEGNKIHLSFEQVNGGLKTPNNKKLKGFAIAGSDKKFRWAKAEIKGENVVVWNQKIANPVAVRYAWAANPVCNLYNKSGLPASPFRTDSWKGITEGAK